jgi:hypothetical protein
MLELLLIASSGEGQRRPDGSPRTLRRGCAHGRSGHEQLAGDAVAGRRARTDAAAAMPEVCKRRVEDKAAGLRVAVVSSSPLRCGDAGGYVSPTDGEGELTPNA